MRKALLLSLLALAATGVAWAGNGPSASGGAHLVVHDVFGLQTLELQTFSFNARADGGNSSIARSTTAYRSPRPERSPA